MVVQSYMNRRCKMWCCCALHEVQSFIIVPLRNNVQYKIIKHLLYYHPVYLQNKLKELWSSECSGDFCFHIFVCWISLSLYLYSFVTV
jgi:hypothetical protein